MKKVTIIPVVLAASVCLGAQSVMAADSLDDKDMLFVFGSESGVNTVMLSDKEMAETEGKFAPWLVSGLIGGSLNAFYTGYNSGWSWDNAGNIAYSFGTGFAGGLIGGLGLAPTVGTWGSVGYTALGTTISQTPYGGW